MPDESILNQVYTVSGAPNAGGQVGLLHMHRKASLIEAADLSEACPPQGERAREVQRLCRLCIERHDRRPLGQEPGPPEPSGARHPRTPDAFGCREVCENGPRDAHTAILKDFPGESVDRGWCSHTVIIHEHEHVSGRGGGPSISGGGHHASFGKPDNANPGRGSSNGRRGRVVHHDDFFDRYVAPKRLKKSRERCRSVSRRDDDCDVRRGYHRALHQPDRLHARQLTVVAASALVADSWVREHGVIKRNLVVADEDRRRRYSATFVHSPSRKAAS